MVFLMSENFMLYCCIWKKVWQGDSGAKDFSIIVTPHRNPMTILAWSQLGGRLISGDASGSLVGWKADSRGQLLIMYHHELKESFTDIAFKMSSGRMLDSR